MAEADPLDGVDKYRAIRLLGRGGMGEVHLCEHRMLGTKVVVKLLHLELASRANLVDRMRLEAQALAQLRHPNLVKVTDFDTTPKGRPYFVMEYLPGRSLREEVAERGGWLPLAEALDFTRQTLTGLGFAHERGLVHRDLKLDNLFVCDAQPGRTRRLLKILDFGVAKLVTGGEGLAPLAVPTSTGMVVGTPRFFAPEQARGQALDGRADIYSLGLCLYVMVAGRGPFDDCKSLVEVARAHVQRVPDPPSRLALQPLPPELDALVLKCVAKRPEERFASAAELAAAVERLQQRGY
jgi:eukaryotic-like serine/threonine-protein kinase